MRVEASSFETLLPALVSYLETPRSERDVKIQFGLRQPEARALLGRAVESGRAVRREPPVRYVASSAQSGAQPTLFDDS